SFNNNGTLEESYPMSASTSPYYWVNSGGRLICTNGVGQTVFGALPTNDKWRLAYAISNPLDTGTGYYPQNIFRLITRSTWHNVSQELMFNINSIVMTDTPNRDGYSG